MNAYRIFAPDEARAIRDGIENWTPGRAANGVDKRNTEADGTVVAERIMESVLIPANFVQAISPPKFNRYRVGDEYALHTDAATQFGVRSDLACTLFLSDDYEGGELVVGEHEVKLPAGDAIVYDCWKPHRVKPVTKGERIAAIFWLQSYIRNPEHREILNMLHGVIDENRAVLGAVHEKLVKLWWS